MKRLSFFLFIILLTFTACIGQEEGSLSPTETSSETESSFISSNTNDFMPKASEPVSSLATDTISTDYPVLVPSEDSIERTFYQYNVISPKWMTTEEAFSNPSLIQKAISCIAKNVKIIEAGAFEKGFIYDFDRDGQNESIIVIQASQGDRDWFDGNYHAVLIDNDNNCNYLASGCFMDFDILQYRDFTHFVMKTGNQTAASGSIFCIYSMANQSFKEEASGFRYDYFQNVFFVVGGPQGMNTQFFFWDSAFQMYSYIRPKEISFEQFIKETNFDQKNIRSYTDDGKEEYISINEVKDEFSIVSITDIVACGTAIYSFTAHCSDGDERFINFVLGSDYIYTVDSNMYPYFDSSEAISIDIKKAIKTALPPK